MMTRTHDSKPTASLVLDNRTILKDGSHPLKLKIGWGKDDNRKWSIGYNFTKEKYSDLLANATRAPYKDIWVHLNAKLRKADNIIRDLMAFFRFEDFKERFFDTPNFKIQVDESSLMFICVAFLLRNQQLHLHLQIHDVQTRMCCLPHLP